MICNLIPFPLLPVFSSAFSNGTENVALNIWWRPLGLPQKCYEHHFIMPLKKNRKVSKRHNNATAKKCAIWWKMRCITKIKKT